MDTYYPQIVCGRCKKCIDINSGTNWTLAPDRTSLFYDDGCDCVFHEECAAKLKVDFTTEGGRRHPPPDHHYHHDRILRTWPSCYECTVHDSRSTSIVPVMKNVCVCCCSDGAFAGICDSCTPRVVDAVYQIVLRSETWTRLRNTIKAKIEHQAQDGISPQQRDEWPELLSTNRALGVILDRLRLIPKLVFKEHRDDVLVATHACAFVECVRPLLQCGAEQHQYIDSLDTWLEEEPEEFLMLFDGDTTAARAALVDAWTHISKGNSSVLQRVPADDDDPTVMRVMARRTGAACLRDADAIRGHIAQSCSMVPVPCSQIYRTCRGAARHLSQMLEDPSSGIVRIPEIDSVVFAGQNAAIEPCHEVMSWWKTTPFPAPYV